MADITVVRLGVPGPAGGVSIAQWAALQGIVDSDGTGAIDTAAAIHSDDADERWLAGFHADFGAATYTAVGAAAPTTSGTLSGSSTALAGPYVTHTTTSSSGNAAQVVGSSARQTRWGIDAVFRVRAGADVTNVRYWVGLFASSPAASSTPAIEQAGFRFDDSLDTNWRAVSGDGALRTTNDSGIAVVANTTYTLRIKTDDGTSISYYVDGDVVATHSTTLPVTSTGLVPYVSVTTRSAEANAIGVHHVKILSR